MVIEIDGDYHNDNEQKEFDIMRSLFLEEYSIIVIRYSNDQVLNNIAAVKKDLLERIEKM